MLGKGKDGQAFGHVFLQPLGQLRGAVSVGFDQFGKGGFGLGQVGRIPDRTQLGADAFADGEAGCMMDGVLGEVELATLPFSAAKDGPAGGAQADMIVGDDVPPRACRALAGLPERPASAPRPLTGPPTLVG